MEHGQQEVQPGISLGRTWRKLPEDLSQRDRLQRTYDDHQRLESHQAVQTPGVTGALLSEEGLALSKWGLTYGGLKDMIKRNTLKSYKR
ncbi:hypothetical protein O181_088094 [Austropuccinia psidii MF-1]|uniref:Uncharacterized protein n=1 Tax=Austropuccinia psidii MF-1 TaxID=1389203 RepID=A0A9Q3IR07_9BASI|nr:hypothetical protein [Austropuccinia psidii MF-1]